MVQGSDQQAPQWEREGKAASLPCKDAAEASVLHMNSRKGRPSPTVFAQGATQLTQPGLAYPVRSNMYGS